MIYIFSAVLLVSNNVYFDIGAQATATLVTNGTTPENDNDFKILSLFIFKNSSSENDSNTKQNMKMNNEDGNFITRRKKSSKKHKTTNKNNKMKKRSKKILKRRKKHSINNNKTKLTDKMKKQNAKVHMRIKKHRRKKIKKGRKSKHAESKKIKKGHSLDETIDKTTVQFTTSSRGTSFENTSKSLKTKNATIHSNLILDLSKVNVNHIKLNKNKTLKTHKHHHKTHVTSDDYKKQSQLQVTASKLFHIPAEIGIFTVRSYHNSSNKHISLRKDKQNPRKLHVHRQKHRGNAESNESAYMIPLSAVVDGPKYITVKANDFELKNNFKLTTKFVGLITSTPYESTAPLHSSKEDDTHFKTGQTESLKNFYKNILMNNKIVALGIEKENNVSAFNNIFQQFFEDIIKGNTKTKKKLKHEKLISFKNEMRHEKAQEDKTTKYKATNEKFSELDDKTDEISDTHKRKFRRKHHTSSNEAVKQKKRRSGDYPPVSSDLAEAAAIVIEYLLRKSNTSTY